MSGPVPVRVTGSLGIDIGDTTGMLVAAWTAGASRTLALARAFQCDRESAPDLLELILARYGELLCCGQIEEFRQSQRGQRLHGTRAQPIREQVPALCAIAARHATPARPGGLILAQRPAVTVKDWATDRRLSAAGLLAVTAGQPHARDAARHSIYAASHDCGLADPLSRRMTSR